MFIPVKPFPLTLGLSHLVFPTAASSFTANVALMDDTSEKFGGVFRVPKTGTLNSVDLIMFAIGQWPTNGIKVSFQDVSSGNPDGGADQFRVYAPGSPPSANVWITDIGLITSDGTDTGTKRSVTKGQLLSVVVEFASFSAGDSLTLGGDRQQPTMNIPSPLLTNISKTFVSSWSVGGSGRPAKIALRYSDGTTASAGFCGLVQTASTVSVSSSTTPDEVGVKFTTSVPMRCAGIQFYITSQVASGTVFRLYDESNTVLTSYTATANDQAMSNQSNLPLYLPFDSSVELEADTVYRVTYLAPSTAKSVCFITWNSNAHLNADLFPEAEATMVATERTDLSSSWTDGTATVWGVVPVMDAIDPDKSVRDIIFHSLSSAARFASSFRRRRRT